MPHVEIIAHRGASADAPENTLAAIQLAWQQGADAAEIDVQLTSDGQLVAIHDDALLRTGGVDWAVKDCALAKLKTLDVGSWKSPQFAGERIPTLAEVLDIVPPGKRLFIEVKCGDEAIPELVRVLANAKTSYEQTVLIGLDFKTITAVKLALPDRIALWVTEQFAAESKSSTTHRGWFGFRESKQAPTGSDDVPLRPPTSELIQRAKTAGLDGLDINDLALRPRGDIAAIRQAGLLTCVWTVNSAARALWLSDEGIESITTDSPHRLNKVFRHLMPPAQLPPCWWIEFTFRDGGKMLTNMASTSDELQEELQELRKYAPSWPSRPKSFRIIPEQTESRTQRNAYSLNSLQEVSVRWNWVRRHVDILSELPVRTCRVLPLTKGPIESCQTPKLKNRLGGPALLPVGCAWPTCGRPSRQATYLGTYDLRGMFDFGRGFPDGISLFFRTKSDCYVAELDCDEGAAVSLFENQELELRTAPQGTLQLPEFAFEVWEMPDFPRRSDGVDLYRYLEANEPWSDQWVNIPGRKIGGYPWFEQGDLLAWLQENSRDVEWHWIGTFKGLIEFGDGGTIYLLAGYDREKEKWQWHFEWQGG